MTLLGRVLSRGYVQGNATKIVDDGVKAKTRKAAFCQKMRNSKDFISAFSTFWTKDIG
jgi:hypothetical protein